MTQRAANLDSLFQLGEEIRAARGEESLRSVARRVSLAPSYLSDIENGLRAPGTDAVLRIAVALKAVHRAERWECLCGRIPADIERAILDAPERWDALRAWLGVKK